TCGTTVATHRRRLATAPGAGGTTTNGGGGVQAKRSYPTNPIFQLDDSRRPVFQHRRAYNLLAMQGLIELPNAAEQIQRGIQYGLHVGAQLFVAHHGNVVADAAVGLARPDVPMHTDTLMIWMSACKPVAAIAVAQLWERDLLGLDDRVVRYIPEFGIKGKE